MTNGEDMAADFAAYRADMDIRASGGGLSAAYPHFKAGWSAGLKRDDMTTTRLTDRCPSDGLTLAWHLEGGLDARGVQRTNGEFIACRFGASGGDVRVPPLSGPAPAAGVPTAVPADPLWMRVISRLSTADWWAIGTAAVVGVVGGVLVGAWWR